MLKTLIRSLAIVTLLSLPAMAGPRGIQSELLDRMVGDWVLTGTIAGQRTTHDVTAEWVLGHQYLRLHEVARDTDDEGEPAYEAIVFLGREQATDRYTCLWLDVTGSGARFPDATGYAEPAADELAFVFDAGGDSVIHTTFDYDHEADMWRWLIDIDHGGKPSTFARVSLTRR